MNASHERQNVGGQNSLPFGHPQRILDIMAPVDLDDLLELVHDEATFGTFLDALAADFEVDQALTKANPEKYKYSAGPLGWEVGTISDFLYNAAGEAGTRLPLRPVADNPWKRCAEMLLIAKVRE